MKCPTCEREDRPWNGKHWKIISEELEKAAIEYKLYSIKYKGEWQSGYSQGITTALGVLTGALKKDCK